MEGTDPTTATAGGRRAGRPRRGRWLRRLFWAFTLLVVLPIVILLAAIYFMLTDAPDYWHVVDADDPQTIAESQAFENILATELTAVRPAGEVWRLDLDERTANQWVATRLPQWLANRGLDTRVLDALRNPMLAVVDDRVEIAAAVDAPIGDVVVQLRFTATAPGAAGNIQLSLDRVRVGSIEVPIEPVIDHLLSSGVLDEGDREDIEHARQQMGEIDLVLPIGDGRLVRVVGLAPTDDGLALSCITAR